MEIKWVTPAGSLGSIPETVTYSFQLVATADSTISFKILAGNLPAGLSMDSNGLITGTPREVNKITVSKFVIRAFTAIDIADRTFTIEVNGDDIPEWVTPAGFIQAGVAGTHYILDDSYVNFQLQAIDSDTAAGDVLTYRLLPNAGEFPPGLSLTPDGLITGYTTPILAIDLQKPLSGYDTTPWDTIPLDHVDRTASGYDDYLYDVDSFDYSESTVTPRKLSRAYTFSVEVSDGFNKETRIFKIYVVSDDFLVQNNIDYQRVPIWITEPYLGKVRANNNITILLDVYNPPTLPGLISYSLPNSADVTLLEKIGLTLNSFTGDLSGSIPKQPAITTRHEFTVKATKYTTTFETPTINIVGDWNASTAYTTTEAVRYSDPNIDNGDVHLYSCLKDNKNIKPNYDSNLLENEQIYSDYWYITSTVDWVAGVTYYENQSVRYTNGEIYICKAKTTEPPTDYAFWYTNATYTNRTFTLEVIGEIDSAIEWITASDLGSILPDHNCTLHLTAKSLLPNSQVSVHLKSGTLPPGLTLLPNGNIIGKVEPVGRFYDTLDNTTTFDITFDGGYTTFGKTFTFTVTANDATNIAAVDRTFTIIVETASSTKYANIYVKAFLSKTQRQDWYSFITDGNLFKSSEFYRPGDVNFGVQTELKTLIYAGIESSDAVAFVQVMSRNHNKKQMLFGDIKYAVGYDETTQEPEYEVIYVEMIDDIDGISPEQQQKLSDDIKAKVLTSISTISIDSDIPAVSDSDKQQVFPNSIENMRARIANSGLHTSTYLPRWMRGIYSAGYAKALVLCYVTPGNAPNVLARIKAKLYTASRGLWTKEAAYQLGDTVSYLGLYYNCVENNTNSIPDSQTPNVVRGNWNSAVNYLLGDNVFFSGKYYTSLQTNTNKPPHTSQVYWMEYQPKWSRNFDFKSLDFTADRYVIDSIGGIPTDRYLAFPNNREN